MTEVGQVPGIQEIADRLAIVEVIHTYARGVDRADAGILKSTCWPDSELDYGGYKGPAYPFCDSLPDGLKNFVNTQHQISNILMAIDGDEARVECYLTAHHRRKDDSEMTYIGRYLDHMEKRGDVWKIKYRKIVMTWHQDAAMSENFDQNASLVPISRATHDDDDPSFSFFAGSNV